MMVAVRASEPVLLDFIVIGRLIIVVSLNERQSRPMTWFGFSLSSPAICEIPLGYYQRIHWFLERAWNSSLIWFLLSFSSYRLWSSLSYNLGLLNFWLGAISRRGYSTYITRPASLLAHEAINLTYIFIMRTMRELVCLVSIVAL